MTGEAPFAIRKRSLSVAGHPTSVSLEEPFWDALRDIAAGRGVSIPALVAAIDRDRGGGNLSSAIRVHVLRHALEEAGRPAAVPSPEG